ncbi:MAG: selenocysteine lyase [Bacteroidetes bacterium RIFCSPLOWO2_12_FULL_35_15]|nr:MAG: selenocysteine lyase [Bacteroidetes bacterium RIFCSPLOWO2_12_FULL_35_15]
MLEDHFKKFRKNTIGAEKAFETPYGFKQLLYVDWTASGRLYRPIEQLISEDIGVFVGNTHSETSVTGSTMTNAYQNALSIIKEHVGANDNDILFSSNSGMTGLVNKFQRILGLRIHEKFKDQIIISEEDKPVVFVTHMEHHSNQVSWIETIAEVVLIESTKDGLVDLEYLKNLLKIYKSRKLKIAAITSCSNVTGIFTPYHQIAELMHSNNGLCFVDFAASAPYININMHPEKTDQYLDAIYFSPHKFLGGPGSSGVLIFNKKLYKNAIPDSPGGGTVAWTNPWGGHKYLDNIEAREDGGTPAFLQTIKAALCINLKNQMGVENMLKREKEMMTKIWDGLIGIPNLHILAENTKDRLGICSFFIDDLHYNLAVNLLNDRFGIQVRSGCFCAGTYGHHLLNIDRNHSRAITNKIDNGFFCEKPGWVRLSIHPVLTDKEIEFCIDAIIQLCKNHILWAKDYTYNVKTNDFTYTAKKQMDTNIVSEWFSRDLAEEKPIAQ